LHCLASSALDQVVDCRNDDNRAIVHFNADIAEIRKGDVFYAWEFAIRPYPHKRLMAVEFWYSAATPAAPGESGFSTERI